MPKTKTDPKQLKKRIADLEKLAERQAKWIADARAARVKGMPRAKALQKRGTFIRVCVPDSHGCYVDRPAFAAMLADIEALRPREVVWLGDHIDCGGFLAQHHTTNYVAQTEYTFAQDCAHGNDHLDRVLKASPGASHHYIEGNHERRIETWICTETLRNHTDSAYLRGFLSPEIVLNLAARGVTYYGQAAHHMGVSVRGCIKLGHCYFIHGISTAKSAAAATLSKFGAPVVYAHVHRAESRADELVSTSTIVAWCPGCLCVKAPMYAHTNPTSWTHGYAVQFVAKDGTFLHLQIPIIDGVSYLRNFLELVKQ